MAEKPQKLAIWVFPIENSQMCADLGQIRHNCYALPNLTPIGAVIRPRGAKKRKNVILIPAVFCR